MKASAHILAVQEALLIPARSRAPRIGPLTRAAFERLASVDPESEYTAAEEDGPRQINAAGLDLVKHFEGLYLKAYKDPAGIWTIGYGHTGLQHMDGTVYAGRSISEWKAEELLRYDMNQFERRADALVEVPLNDNQFSALVSFDFNTGGLAKSTLLKKLNAGDYDGAAGQFGLWVNAGGRRLSGLVRRRRSERNLFLSTQPYIEMS